MKEKFNVIYYAVLIDGKENTLTFSEMDRHGRYVYKDDIGETHAFEKPLALYQLNKCITANKHNYVVLRKP